MNNEINKNFELDDDMLDDAVGGIGENDAAQTNYEIGDTVFVEDIEINYCRNCGRLLLNYEGKITGLRGILEGKPIYWVACPSCGHERSVSEIAIKYKI